MFLASPGALEVALLTLVSEDSDKSYQVIKVREIRIVKGVMAGDVSPVAMF